MLTRLLFGYWLWWTRSMYHLSSSGRCARFVQAWPLWPAVSRLFQRGKPNWGISLLGSVSKSTNRHGGDCFFFAREELNKHTCHSDWCFRMFQLSVCNVCRDSTVTGSEPYALESLCLNSSAGTSLLSIQGANLREYLKGVESFKLIR